MSDLNARPARRILVWSDELLDLFDQLREMDVRDYIVGGAVRDALMGRPVKDLDIATPESGTRLARSMADRLGGAYYPLDAERETGRVILDTQDGRFIIDVARFRGDDLLADLRDRDFTMNAIAVDLRGDPAWVIDPTEGERDIADRVLRRCHEYSLESDPIRVLRGVRQSVQFGLRVEPSTLADMRQCAPLLRTTSSERVRDEFFKLLGLPKAVAALKVADSVGALAIILPEAVALREQGLWQETLDTMERLVEIIITISPKRTDQTAAKFSLGMLVMGLDKYRQPLLSHTQLAWADERPHQALLLFALLLGAVDATGSEARARQMPLSNRELDRLLPLLQAPDAYAALGEDRSALTLHRYWRAFGDGGIDLLLLYLARFLARTGVAIDQDRWIREIELARLLLETYFERYAQVVAPPVLLDGNDLMQALSLKPGRQIGKLLDAIREAQVEGVVTTTDEALSFARRFLDNGVEE
jgi:tRNA nucleotidyltransferase/poly(A) polymerase